jgi:hypothetical protein
MSDHETFAGRWNRRKLQAKREEVVPVASAPAAVPVAEPVDDRPLPKLDEITPESSIAQFLEKRIPAELQKLALRKAWSSDPAISSFVEVAENQYDWNAPGGCPGYGPMDPSWDLEKLLAHATGAQTLELEDVALTKETGNVPGPGRDIVTHHEEPLTDGLVDNAQVAAHNTLSTDGCGMTSAIESAAIKPAMHVEISESPAGADVDMSHKTQRLASHNSGSFLRRRHGGALPSS